MASSIDIIVKVIDEASKALKDITKSTDELGKEGKSTGEQLKGLGKAALTVTAAVAAFGVAAKAAFDMGKAGAAVKQTGESFGFLIKKVGGSADLLDKLRSASKGTVDDMTLMSSTATLLAGAQGALGERLAEATPQLLNIAKAAQKLNPSLGDTTFLYNSLAVGIKRGSPLILDNLGLLVSQGDANKRLAAELGKTVAALTTEEMKMALLNETIRAGTVLVQQAGGDTDSATDSYDQLTAAVSNLTDRYKAQIHEGIKPVLEATKNYVVALDKAKANSHHVEKAVAAATVEMGTAVYKTTELSERVQELSQNYIATAADVLAAGGAIEAVSGMIEVHSTAIERTSDNTMQMDRQTKLLSIAMGESTIAIEASKSKLVNYKDELNNTELSKKRTEQATMLLIDKIVQEEQTLALLTKELENAGQATKDLEQANLDIAASADKAMMGFHNSIRELSYLKQETGEAKEATVEFRRVQDKVDIAMGRTNQMIIDQRDKVERLRHEWEDSNFTNKDLERQLQSNIKSLEIYTNTFNENTRDVDNNTRAIADNTAINKANRELRDAVAVATGRETAAMVALRLEQEHWSDIYRNSVGPAKVHALNMVLATAIALQNETQAHRINTSALSSATSQQIAYNNAIAGSGTGAGGFTGSVSGDVAGGLGLKSMDDMRKELGVASGTGFWDAASERDVMAEYYKLTQQAAGLEPDWDAFYDQINEDRAERGEDPITVKDSSPQEKAQQLKSRLETMQDNSSIYNAEGNIKDWAQPLFDAIEDPSSPTGFFQGFQHGANFTVPAGFNNDGFMMGVSSGEHVKVTPSHMNSGQGGLMINNLNVYGVQTASELYETIIQQARMRGKDFAKVL
jgi:hypothetical protein